MTGLLQNMAFISMPGGGEWMVILIIGLLIFGRRLPEVARNLGKTVNEFKKGMREFQDSANEVARDVTKAANDATSDDNTYGGTSSYGYEEPGTATDYNTGHYDPAASTDASAATPQDTGPSEPVVTSDVVEGGDVPEIREIDTPAEQDARGPSVESST